MGWGSALANMAKRTGSAVAGAASSAAHAVVGRITAAAKATGAAVTAAEQAVAKAAVATEQAVASAAVATGKAVASAAVAGGHAAKAAAAVVANAVGAAYDAVKQAFEPTLVGAPIQECPTTTADKIKRLKERSDLIAKARATKADPATEQRLTDAADRLERNNKSVERARLADDVYKDHKKNGGSPPPGWKRVSDDPAQFEKGGALDGLSPSDFEPKDSGFRAALYKSEIDGKYVLAFKGTTMTSGEDWMNNARQGMGYQSDYYTRAIQLTKTASDATDDNIEVTGHSLGGGMCTAAGIVSNVPCTAFNPAGVNENTLAVYGKSRENASKVQTYQVQDEILTRLQGEGTLLPNAVGEKYALPEVDKDGRSPSLADSTVEGALGGPYRLYRGVQRHAMQIVINGIEKQKADDQTTMKTLLNVQ